MIKGLTSDTSWPEANQIELEDAESGARVQEANSIRRPRGLEPKVRERLIDHIGRNLARRILVAELAQVAKLKEHELRRAFRVTFGTPPAHYIHEMRLELARILLRDTTYTIAEIAHAIGFPTRRRFTVEFRRCRGMSPTAYRFSEFPKL